MPREASNEQANLERLNKLEQPGRAVLSLHTEPVSDFSAVSAVSATVVGLDLSHTR
jgi:hypothetical protein